MYNIDNLFVFNFISKYMAEKKKFLEFVYMSTIRLYSKIDFL